MRGSRPASIVIWRISSVPRPSGRFFWIAMRSRMIDFSSLSNASCALPRVLGVLGSVLGSPEYWAEDLLLDGLRGVLAGELVLDRRGLVELLPVRALDLLEQAGVDLRRLDLELRGLAGLLAELAHGGDQLLDLRVRDVERVEDLGLGDLVGARLDHQDGLVGAGDHEVEVGREEVLLVRVDDEVAVDLADPDRADGLAGTGCWRPSAPRRRRSWRGCRTGRHGRSTAGSRRAASRGASPWGRAGAAGGRSCGRRGCPSRRSGPRA